MEVKYYEAKALLEQSLVFKSIEWEDSKANDKSF